MKEVSNTVVFRYVSGQERYNNGPWTSFIELLAHLPTSSWPIYLLEQESYISLLLSTIFSKDLYADHKGAAFYHR